MTHTVEGLVTHQLDIRKSRFVALAGAVQTVEQALGFFARYSVVDATHNCWAYKVGTAYRYNDDGEPGGTAGRPILQAIEGQGCDQVAVLVVRWFGGIKLGPGGLVRAYGGVAAECLRLAPKIPLIDEVSVDCHCQFADMALLQSRFAAFGARVIGETFDEQGVRWRLAVARAQEPTLAQLFTNLTRGQGLWRVVNEADGQQ
jgi:putative IMPACT (imprinted ancient) family translation regulator